MTERAPRLDERVVTLDVAAMAGRVAGFMACGMSDLDIRRRLGLSRRQFRTVMEAMRREARDTSNVWARHLAVSRVNIERLERVRRDALATATKVPTGQFDDEGNPLMRYVPTTPDLALAARCTVEIQRISEGVIATGQELGEYKRAAKKIDVAHSLVDMVEQAEAGQRALAEDHPEIDMMPDESGGWSPS